MEGRKLNHAVDKVIIYKILPYLLFRAAPVHDARETDNITTYNLCRINMFLHDVGFDKFDIACEDTLTAPQHWDDEPFELIVSRDGRGYKW